jgi:leader peptidase (prepilin peptidase) / N-methyltransferase
MIDKSNLIFPPVLIIVGWISGIIVNYLADVLPVKRSLARPFCSSCDSEFEPGNYFIWPRRCKTCGKRRRVRTWVVEAVFVAIGACLWFRSPERLGVFLSLVLFIYFASVAIIDLEHRLIMHVVSLAGAILCLGVGVWLHGIGMTLLGGLAGFGIMLVFYILGLGFIRLLRRWRNQVISENEALGFGDVSLSGVIGLLVGWPGILGVLVLGILLAGLVSLIYLLFMVANRKYHPGLALPYGPFLIVVTIAMLFYREFLPLSAIAP